MKIEFELTGLKEAKDKIDRFRKSARDGASAVVAGVVDGVGGHYSAYYNMRKNAQTIVYGVYEPREYVRKYQNGGILGAIKGEWNGGLEARVYIDGAALADKMLANGMPYFWRVLVGDSGYPYDYPVEGAAFMRPRDFFTPTVESMRKSIESGAFRKKMIQAINAAKSA